MTRARTSPLSFFARRPLLAAALGAGCIAFSAPFVRLAGTTPTNVAMFRCAYALPVLGALAWIERARFGPRTRRAHGLAVIAGLAFTVDLITWHHSIDAVGAGLATVLGNMQVVIVGVLAWWLFKERFDRGVLIATPAVVVGVVLVSGVLGNHAYGKNPALGVIYGVCTSIAYSVFILAHREGAKDLARPAGPLFEATLVTTIASAIYGSLSHTVSFTPHWPSHGWLLLLALSSQVIGWLFLSVSLPRLSAGLSSVLLLLQPVGALALGGAMFGERPSLVQLGGVALILAGVIAAARGRAPETGPVPEPATP